MTWWCESVGGVDVVVGVVVVVSRCSRLDTGG
jgi:hypothetical protein